MSVSINVKLPSQGADEAELTVLSRFSETIAKNWVQCFCLTCNPNWEHDPKITSAKHFRLMSGEQTSREVLSESILALGSMTVEQFLDKLKAAAFNLGDDDDDDIDTLGTLGLPGLGLGF